MRMTACVAFGRLKVFPLLRAGCILLSMHSFYFNIWEDPTDPAAREREAEFIITAAAVADIGYHAEIHRYDRLTAVYVTIEDDQDAAAFRLTVPPALVRSR